MALCWRFPPPLEVGVSFRNTPTMPRRFSLFVIALCITAFTSLAQEPAITPKHSRHFTRYEGCEFVPTKYADGDSCRLTDAKKRLKRR